MEWKAQSNICQNLYKCGTERLAYTMRAKKLWPKRRKDLRVCTVGHSNLALIQFLWLILKNEVDVVADVRSEPVSRIAPHFNSRNLKDALKAIGVRYVPLGNQLGGRPSAEEFYDHQGYVLYQRLAESPDFKGGLERLLVGIREHHVAIMCSEEDPANCHRRLLVGRALEASGVKLYHLRANGRIQEEDELTRDLQAKAHIEPQLSLVEPIEGVPWRSKKSIRSDSPKDELKISLEH
ncbi:MAG: DUF488 domain-containing protein [Chloroflexi bacterium]|nr:DUF488 domain-containing protein [Chloroflexota bacterium]